MTREIPIIARRIEPHPGGDRFGHCAFCLFGSRRYVRSDVIVYSTYTHDKRPAIRGLCANHAELLEKIQP